VAAASVVSGTEPTPATTTSASMAVLRQRDLDAGAGLGQPLTPCRTQVDPGATCRTAMVAATRPDGRAPSAAAELDDGHPAPSARRRRPAQPDEPAADDRDPAARRQPRPQRAESA